jgi:hypothetical protein
MQTRQGSMTKPAKDRHPREGFDGETELRILRIRRGIVVPRDKRRAANCDPPSRRY